MDRGRYPGSGQIREWMDAVEFSDCVTREVQHSGPAVSSEGGNRGGTSR